ncbi:MAG: zinc-ribbon and DUF3426 domain-containing protein [Rubrivivax sp.]|nr:zinc-ribbon and DUF3426 domain-containing protein [Rubrivivax sp.]
MPGAGDRSAGQACLMSAPLATRCPACSTVFRVVPDQLRVSEGWVRCGRCAEVFDATESLVDLESGEPRRWGGETLRRAAHDADASAAPRPDAPFDPAGPGLASLAPPQSEPAPTGLGPAPDADPPSPPAETDTVAAPATATGDSADAQAPPRDVTAAAAGAATDAGTEPCADPADPADPADRPSFVRRAERVQRWQQPRVRAALVALAVLGVAGLAGQVTYAYRDLAAARFPQARPALEQACALLGCRIEAARAIGALAVDSSGLVRVEKSGLYKLSVALRNQAGIEVALPALELSLTDTQGRLIARKVLLAADLGVAPSTLGAGRELALQATLQAALPATEPVAGYTIELFYP